MTRASLLGLISSLGAVLATGCGTSEPIDKDPAQSPTYLEPTSGQTTLSGYAWDPEAFFMSTEGCKAAPKPPQNGTTEYCPIPPLLSEVFPLYNLAAVKGASIFVIDPLAPPTDPPKFTTTTPASGLWRIEGLPSRDNVPYLVANLGTGSLSPDSVGGLPAVAAAPYLPTVTLRPFLTGNARLCPLGEAMQTSDRGVLEAVAKYQESKGKPTQVTDFLNPAKYTSVAVFWLYLPAALPNLLFPAAGTSIQASAGVKYHIAWKPVPTSGPTGTQSRRGFYVDDKATSSPIGVTVVVIPAGTPLTPTMTYVAQDTVTNAALGRPLVFPPLPLQPVPGIISAVSLQLMSSAPLPDGKQPAGPPWFLCVQ